MSKKEKTEKKERKVNPDERAVFDAPVKSQRGDIFKVISKGVTIEFTDNVMAANSAYKETLPPKSMFKIHRGSGSVEKIYETFL